MSLSDQIGPVIGLRRTNFDEDEPKSSRHHESSAMEGDYLIGFRFSLDDPAGIKLLIPPVLSGSVVILLS